MGGGEEGVRVCVCGCVGVGGCGVGVWVCGCVRACVWVCVWVCGCVGVWVVGDHLVNVLHLQVGLCGATGMSSTPSPN